MTDLSSLISRLEKATGPDTELDVDIAIALGVIPSREWWSTNYVKAGILGRYTASVDAAISLAERVLPGCGHGYDKKPGGRIEAYLNQSDEQWTYAGWPYVKAATPPLALVLATLRALQSHTGEA